MDSTILIDIENKEKLYEINILTYNTAIS